MNPIIQSLPGVNRFVVFPMDRNARSGIFTVPTNVTRLRVIAQASGAAGGAAAIAGGAAGSAITFTNLSRDILTTTSVVVGGAAATGDTTGGVGGTGIGCYAGGTGPVGPGAASAFGAGALQGVDATVTQYGVGGGGKDGSSGGGGSGALLDNVFTVVPGQQISFTIGAPGAGANGAGSGGPGIIIFEWGVNI